MGTKYATILVGGVVQTYNDDPPSDDGSQTEANRVKYSTVTTDLTAPLHSACIRMDGKLVDHVNEGPTAKAGNFTTTTAEHNQVIECTGTITIDLLNPTGNAGYQTTVKNAGSGTITLEVDGGANIDGAASTTLLAGESRKCYVNSGGTAYYSTMGLGWAGIVFEQNDIMLIQTSDDVASQGWTKLTSAAYSDTAVRVVTTPGAGGTGQSDFSTVFGLTATDGHTLTSAQSGVAPHGHTIEGRAADGGSVTGVRTPSTGAIIGDVTTDDAIGASASEAHSHAIDLRVNYCEMMAQQKD